MLGEIRQKIEYAKEELEYLIFRYGLLDERVIEKNNMIDSLIVEYHLKSCPKRKIGNIIYVTF